jgi:hypothetical protein
MSTHLACSRRLDNAAFALDQAGAFGNKDL